MPGNGLSVPVLRNLAQRPDQISNNAIHHFRSVKRLTAVLEGRADRRFLCKFLDSEDVVVAIAGDKPSVREAIETISRQATRFSMPQFAIAVIDLDYERICGSPKLESSWYVYVDYSACGDISRDTEVMLVRSKALWDLLLQDDLEAECDSIRGALAVAGASIGAVRVVSQEELNAGRRHLGTMQELPWDIFFEAPLLQVDLHELVNSLCRGAGLSTVDADRIEARAREVLGMYSSWELARGHDLVQMLAWFLESRLGRRVNHLEVEKDLRLAYDSTLFWSGRVGKRLSDWRISVIPPPTKSEETVDGG